MFANLQSRLLWLVIEVVRVLNQVRVMKILESKLIEVCS